MKKRPLVKIKDFLKEKISYLITWINSFFEESEDDDDDYYYDEYQ